MRQRIGLLAAALALGACASADEIDDIAHKWMTSDRVPGVSVAVFRGGQELALRQYGISNLDYDVPVRVDTSFELASLGKPYTGVAIMLLVEEGKVGLDESIRTYLPTVPESWGAITVRNLMNHTTGWPFLTLDYAKLSAARPLRYTVAKQIEDTAKSPLPAVPGTKFSYSNFNYTLLAAIVKAASGMPYSKFIQTRILDPNGLKETRFTDVEAIRKGRAANYTRRGDELAMWSLQRVLQAVDDPAFAGMESTARDVAKFQNALYAGRILKSDTWRQMLVPSKLANGTALPVGLTFFVGQIAGRPVATHTGYSGTMEIQFTDDGLAIAVMTNLGSGYPAPFGTDRGFDVGRMGTEIAEAAARKWPKRSG